MELRPGRNASILWSIYALLLFLPFFFVIGVFMAFSLAFWLTICILFVIIYFLLLFWYFPLLRSTAVLRLTPTHLEWTAGVFMRLSIRLELRQILYVTYTQTPFQRLLGLCTVAVHPVGKTVWLFDLEHCGGELVKSFLEASHEK